MNKTSAIFTLCFSVLATGLSPSSFAGGAFSRSNPCDQSGSLELPSFISSLSWKDRLKRLVGMKTRHDIEMAKVLGMIESIGTSEETERDKANLQNLINAVDSGFFKDERTRHQLNHSKRFRKAFVNAFSRPHSYRATDALMKILPSLEGEEGLHPELQMAFSNRLTADFIHTPEDFTGIHDKFFSLKDRTEAAEQKFMDQTFGLRELFSSRSEMEALATKKYRTDELRTREEVKQLEELAKTVRVIPSESKRLLEEKRNQVKDFINSTTLSATRAFNAFEIVYTLSLSVATHQLEKLEALQKSNQLRGLSQFSINRQIHVLNEVLRQSHSEYLKLKEAVEKLPPSY